MLARYYRDPFLCLEQESLPYTYYRQGHPDAEEIASRLSEVERAPCLLFASGLGALAAYLWAVSPRRIYVPYPVYMESVDLAVRFCQVTGGRVVWDEPTKRDAGGVVLVDSAVADLERFRGFVLRPGVVRRLSELARVVVDVTTTCPGGHPDFLGAGADAVWSSLSKYMSAGSVPGGALWVTDRSLRLRITNDSMRLLGAAFYPSRELVCTLGLARWLRERCVAIAGEVASVARRRGFRVLQVEGLVYVKHAQSEMVNNLVVGLSELGVLTSRGYGTPFPSMSFSAQRGELRIHPGVDAGVVQLVSECVDRA